MKVSKQRVGVPSKRVFQLTLAMIVTLVDPFSVESETGGNGAGHNL